MQWWKQQWGTHECLCDTHSGISDLELTQNVLRHVVFSHGIHHKVLVPSRALCWPVLMALFLKKEREVKPQQSKWACCPKAYEMTEVRAFWKDI